MTYKAFFFFQPWCRTIAGVLFIHQIGVSVAFLEVILKESDVRNLNLPLIYQVG